MAKRKKIIKYAFNLGRTGDLPIPARLGQVKLNSSVGRSYQLSYKGISCYIIAMLRS